jgi:2-oxoglutarate dehydrogenase E1 component
MGLEGFIQSGFANPELYEQMYAKYLEDPGSVHSSWRFVFENFEKEPEAPMLPSPVPIPQKVPEQPLPRPQADAMPDIRIYNLIHAYRVHGHLLAKINPIQAKEHPEPDELKLANLGFYESELSMEFPTCGITNEEFLPLRDIITILREIYCSNIGIEYKDRHSPELEHWLQSRIEPSRCQIELSINEKQMILQHLNKSGLFEWFLQTKYVGQKRFSLEGGETLIPIFASIIEKGSQLGMNEFVVGMAHRGRLNVLCNILNKSYENIFSEFEDYYIPEALEGSGDVKYHKGFSSEITSASGEKIKIFLCPNPSHLESVCPVVEGKVRARQTKYNDAELREKYVPILVHGDAALTGQGVVYETMQMSQLRGYETGGTIHIVINNQIGFTTIPEDARSTHYCTDIAKTFGAPVFHVNAENPEACIYATNLAIELRQKFHCDVFIDLNCYRKYGHNEGDEPVFTQPLEYAQIRSKKSIREIYRDQLLHEGVLEKYLAEELEEEFKKGLKEALKKVKEIEPRPHPEEQTDSKEEDLFKKVDSSVPAKTLKDCAKAISKIPSDFNPHKKLKQLIKSREAMIVEGQPIDWGMAELMAYATLLQEGTHIRISGQDSCRGTFSHRHAVWMDQKEEREYYPLKHISANQGHFDIYNSLLSEYAVLGYEYGFSVSYRDALVIWEAQFGDFSNGAQIIIDQYLAPGEQKWGQHSNLVLYLPHGYEGQGPEHSSARMERYLVLCGEDNMTLVNPTTPAQMFHLIRRHMLIPSQVPLIVFTPKGLLRHPECTSDVDELAHGRFEEVLDDPNPPRKTTRLAICSGRIYYDLIEERKKRKADDIAFIRIEQLYPLHTDRLREIIGNYPNIEEFLWVQEEPSNMGAWHQLRPQINRLLPQNKRLLYVGRNRSASPATGSHRRHEQQHAAILKGVFPGGEKLDVNVNLMQRV